MKNGMTPIGIGIIIGFVCLLSAIFASGCEFNRDLEAAPVSSDTIEIGDIRVHDFEFGGHKYLISVYGYGSGDIEHAMHCPCFKAVGP